MRTPSELEANSLRQAGAPRGRPSPRRFTGLRHRGAPTAAEPEALGPPIWAGGLAQAACPFGKQGTPTSARRRQVAQTAWDLGLGRTKFDSLIGGNGLAWATTEMNF